MKLKKHFNQILIKQTIDKVNKLSSDKVFCIAIGVSDNRSFDVYPVQYIGQYKKYPGDICDQQSKDRVFFYLFSNMWDRDMKKLLLRELNSYIKVLDSFTSDRSVCSNEQTKPLKLSTRRVTNE